MFLVQREDAKGFSPDDDADPVFGHTLRWAASLGIEAYAYHCQVGLEDITIEKDIPLWL